MVVRLSERFGAPESVLLETDKGKVCLNLRDPLMLNVPNRLLYEHPEFAAVSSLLRPGDTFLDIGANHGTFSIMASARVGATGLVVSIEPQPKLASLIERSLQANKAAPFAVHSFACGEINGETEFYVPRFCSGWGGIFSGFSAVGDFQSFRVPVRRIDEALEWRAFPGKLVVKMDVEGSELATLRGAEAMLRHWQPPILLEINPRSGRAAGVPIETMVQCLRQIGYEDFADPVLPLQRKPISSLDLTQSRNVLFFYGRNGLSAV
jgi:FkbM family methyltransferase